MASLARKRLLRAGRLRARAVKAQAERWFVVTLMTAGLVTSGLFAFRYAAAEKGLELLQLDAELAEQRRNAAPAVTVTVTTDAVLVDGVTVAEAAALVRDQPLIPQLLETLQDRKRKEPSVNACVVRSTKDVQFWVIKQLMATCATAGYPDIGFQTFSP